MAEKEDKPDKEMEEAIKKVGENPQYKVLTREEYEALMKGTIPKTSTPRVPLPPQTPKTLFGARTPGLTPGSRLQQLLNISGANQSIAVPSYNPLNYPFSVVQMNQLKVKQAMKFGVMKLNAFRTLNTYQNMCS